MALVGAPATAATVHPFSLIMGSRIRAGSAIGGIVSDIELIPIEQINAAYERVLKSDVRYRFVIDVSTLRDPVA